MSTPIACSLLRRLHADGLVRLCDGLQAALHGVEPREP
jgi:hypothetical protein